MPVIGYLSARRLERLPHLVAAFRRGLEGSRLREGQNVAIEYRWAEGQIQRLPRLAAELVRRPVRSSSRTRRAALAAKAATTTIPIVFVIGGDPVGDGLVASLNRPGGNVTGMSLDRRPPAKRLEMLRDLVPRPHASPFWSGPIKR